jgi:hypothetical protein
VSWAEREVAHLTLDASGIAPISARHNAILEDFVENRVMKGLLFGGGNSAVGVQFASDYAHGVSG